MLREVTKLYYRHSKNTTNVFAVIASPVNEDPVLEAEATDEEVEDGV